MTTQNIIGTTLSGQSGTGNFAGTTSPTFVTPALGTPASGNLVNCTGVSTGSLSTTNTSSNTAYYLPLVSASTTSNQTVYVASTLTFNASTGLLTSSGNVLTKVNGTESGAAVTANGYSGIITTSSLSTAAGGNYGITWTNNKLTATTLIFCSVVGGTNTNQHIDFVLQSGASIGAIIIYNTHPTAAFNGTIQIGYMVC
jgi:hypothetical protein